MVYKPLTGKSKHSEMPQCQGSESAEIIPPAVKLLQYICLTIPSICPPAQVVAVDQDTFDTAKVALTSCNTLAHYDPENELI